MKTLLVTVVFILASMAVAAAWFFLRALLVSLGAMPPTADDHVVRGWKAQRRGQWAAALLAYCKALQMDPQHPDAKERYDALLAALPELTDEVTLEEVLTTVQRRLTARAAKDAVAAALQAERDRQKAIEDDDRAKFWLGDLLAEEHSGPTEGAPADPDRPSEPPAPDEGAGRRNAPSVEPTTQPEHRS